MDLIFLRFEQLILMIEYIFISTAVHKTHVSIYYYTFQTLVYNTKPKRSTRY